MKQIAELKHEMASLQGLVEEEKGKRVDAQRALGWANASKNIKDLKGFSYKTRCALACTWMHENWLVCFCRLHNIIDYLKEETGGDEKFGEFIKDLMAHEHVRNHYQGESRTPEEVAGGTVI